jgi:hypothetical protein
MDQQEIDIQCLTPKLTEEFLDILVEAVKVCGWEVDHVESAKFVKWCHKIAGVECPDLEPNDYLS